MKIPKMLMQAAVICAVLLTASAFGAEKAEKVTGEFVRAPGPNPSVIPVQITEIAAHEATGSRSQKGYLFTHTDRDGDGVYENWKLIDFNDEENTCVHVYGDAVARVGGLISEGNSLVGRFLGYDLLDGGPPNTDDYVDFITILWFSDPDPENPGHLLQGFKHWCDTGEDPLDVILGAFPKYAKEGNLTIHNYPSKD